MYVLVIISFKKIYWSSLIVCLFKVHCEVSYDFTVTSIAISLLETLMRFYKNFYYQKNQKPMSLSWIKIRTRSSNVRPKLFFHMPTCKVEFNRLRKGISNENKFTWILTLWSFCVVNKYVIRIKESSSTKITVGEV